MDQKNWYSLSEEEVASSLKSDLKNGLNTEQVEKAREIYGTNEIVSKGKKSVLKMIIEQFTDFMIIVLIIAAIVSGVASKEFTDSIIILIIVILNAVIGVVQELKAQKSLDALKNLSTPTCKVVRNSKVETISSKELVPGDIVILDTGDFVPADMRLIEAVNLKIQEAALTGESVPVEKDLNIINKENVGVGDKTNCAFSSSLVTYGRGKGIVTETGMNTEVGKIATMLDSVDENETPLKRRLEALGKTLGIAALVICLIIFLVGSLVHGRDLLSMFMTAVSLAVAAIPEGLPAISTIVLSIGVQRMVKRNAIIRTLPSVETLGSATVICSDKTGTLTQNKMTVEKVFYNSKVFNTEEKVSNIDEHYTLLLNSMILCNDSKLTKENESYKVTGDPTETALVDLGLKSNFIKPKMDDEFRRIEEIPFDSDRKLMTTVHEVGNEKVVYTKGGLDELLACCNKILLDGNVLDITEEHKAYIRKVNEELATNALRVLAMAYKKIDEIPSKENMSSLESDLVYIGMVGMIDPARPEVKEAVAKCKTAGIRPVMITGDHKITAVAIAKEIGILNEGDRAVTGEELEKMSQEELEKNVKDISVYARVSPEHKVRIVKAWQSHGEVVAMTGDGVNDAPALKTSDIGAAMGIVGTDVAKEAADVVLTDDNFATIVSAVEEGRRIYDNILKAVAYLLSSNIGEIIVLFIATMLGWAIEPLLPIHILWINLVTDSLPALALSVDPAEKDIMKRKARKDKNIFSKGMIKRVIYQGIMVGTLTLLAFCIGCGWNFDEIAKEVVIDGKTQVVATELGKTAQTMAFAVLALCQLTHVFNLRSNKESIFKVGFLTNKTLIGAVALSAVLMFVVLSVPFLQGIFEVVKLPFADIEWVGLLVIAPIIIVEMFKLLKWNTVKEEN